MNLICLQGAMDGPFGFRCESRSLASVLYLGFWWREIWTCHSSVPVFFLFQSSMLFSACISQKIHILPGPFTLLFSSGILVLVCAVTTISITECDLNTLPTV